MRTNPVKDRFLGILNAIPMPHQAEKRPPIDIITVDTDFLGCGFLIRRVLGGLTMGAKEGKEKKDQQKGEIKTNAMRLLDGRKVEYSVYTYSPEHHSADEVAALLGLEAAEVYKTLVVLREKGKPLLVMIAGDRELHPRELARAIGEKRVAMAPQKEAERLTGLQVGGIGALALLNRSFDVVIDARALDRESILVNAGQRGLNLRVKVSDLIAITSAIAAAVSREPTDEGQREERA